MNHFLQVYEMIL